MGLRECPTICGHVGVRRVALPPEKLIYMPLKVLMHIIITF
jgi:hypothetical protein